MRKLFIISLMFIYLSLSVSAYQVSWQGVVLKNDNTNVDLPAEVRITFNDTITNTIIWNQTYEVQLFPTNQTGVHTIIDSPDWIRNRNYSTCFYLNTTTNITEEFLGCHDFFPSAGRLVEDNITTSKIILQNNEMTNILVNALQIPYFGYSLYIPMINSTGYFDLTDSTINFGTGINNRLFIMRDGEDSGAIGEPQLLFLNNLDAGYVASITYHNESDMRFESPVNYTFAPSADNVDVLIESHYDSGGNLYVDGNISSNTDICLAGGSCLSNINSFFYGKTLTTYNGSLGGYEQANAICDAYYSGSHLCQEYEIIQTVQYKDISTIAEWDGYAWYSSGGAKYTGSNPANDCNGWTSSSTSYLGDFWKFDALGGSGAMVNCGELKSLACCMTW